MWYLHLLLSNMINGQVNLINSLWVINFCFINVNMMIYDYCILVILWHVLKEVKSTDVICADVPTSASSTLRGTCASSVAKRRSLSVRSALTDPVNEKHWKCTSLWSTQTLKCFVLTSYNTRREFYHHALKNVFLFATNSINDTIIAKNLFLNKIQIWNWDSCSVELLTVQTV